MTQGGFFYLQNKRNRTSWILTIPNLLYNWMAWVLTEDQSDRPISNLSVEMSEATDRRVVSFVLDIIYDVTRCKVKTPKRVGLAVLLKILTWNGSIWLVLSQNPCNQVIQQIRYGYRLVIYKATNRGPWNWRLHFWQSQSPDSFCCIIHMSRYPINVSRNV
jgi:hypothetical protein